MENKIYIGTKDMLKFRFKLKAVVCIDDENRRVYLQNGRPLNLTIMEFNRLVEEWDQDNG